jgi:hypothetical protein
MSNREKSLTRRMGATKGLAFQQQEGRSVLKVLDALVRRASRGRSLTKFNDAHRGGAAQ